MGQYRYYKNVLKYHSSRIYEEYWAEMGLIGLVCLRHTPEAYKLTLVAVQEPP